MSDLAICSNGEAHRWKPLADEWVCSACGVTADELERLREEYGDE